jgi:hypothetical protein
MRSGSRWLVATADAEVRISVGVAFSPDHGSDPVTLIRHVALADPAPLQGDLFSRPVPAGDLPSLILAIEAASWK